MINSAEAVYEKGVFRPLLAIPELSEGQRVRIAVEFSRDADTEEILELAASVYDGLPEQDVNKIENIALNRKTFFREGQITENAYHYTQKA
jgi:predicted DNA-binding antitoxin AbrB/MazE fold protein